MINSNKYIPNVLSSNNKSEDNMAAYGLAFLVLRNFSLGIFLNSYLEYLTISHRYVEGCDYTCQLEVRLKI